MNNKSTLVQLLTATLFSLPLFEAFSQTNTWTPKANLPALSRMYAVGFSIGNKGYIGAGIESFNLFPSKDFWEWDQASDVWTQKANFGGGGRYGAVGFSIGTKGYIGTGCNDITISALSYEKDFWEWDQTTNIWVQKADFAGTSRYFAVGFSIGAKGYIGTGIIPNLYSDFWEWDQASDVWTQKASFGGGGRYGSVGFSIGSKGYIGTGLGFGHKQDFWEWDQTTDVWTQKADFGGGLRVDAVGFSIGAKGYIGGGRDVNSACFNDFWEWDQGTNTWLQKTNIGSAIGRYGTVGFSIGNKGYIGSGADCVPTGTIIITGHPKPLFSLGDFWEYAPDGCTATAVISSDPSSTVCVGQNVFISASGGTTYSWNTGATGANIVAAPSVTTTYSVTVTDAAGCTGIGTLTVPVDPGCTATGMAQLNAEALRAEVWPSPS
ncbi:MAG: hypothetical protein EPN85_12645, partial [Bacteroidetes bacterium]